MEENNTRVSIAMATYNGQKYIKEQVESILVNMGASDELIVSDDSSFDNTISIIKSFKDKRIKLIKGPQKGIKENFNNAISNCKGKYIFLSDQDDIWEKDKIEKVLKKFEESKADLVIHDAIVVDENLDVIKDSFFEFRHSGKGVIKNIWKNTYIGCCMAFDRKILNKILPIPNNIEMHDQWIGVMNDIYGKTYFLHDKLIKYRRHMENNSKMEHYNIKRMFSNRCRLIIEIVRRIV